MASDEDHAPAATVTLRRRPRLVRGPLTIGEPSPPVEVRLGAEEPYRPDTIADGGHACGLTVRAASVRGLSKRFAGGPRQDDLCLRVHEPTNTLIAAVADGVSGAARSGLAAALAVRYATAAVARQLDADAGADAGAGAGELDWGEIFRQAAWALVEEHRREARDDDAGVEHAAATLATTLLVAAVAGPGEDGEASRVQLAAVGDSPAYMLANRAFEPVVGEPQDRDGLIGGGVEALPRAQEPQSHACTLAPGSALLLCTDGVSLPLADGSGEVGRTLARELANPPGIVDFAGLLDFSRATYDDDRTLVAIWAKR
jgi:serine/threonine protein phosphatase PrpC